MKYNDINFNKKTILITDGAGSIGSNLAFYFQKYFTQSTIIIFNCFRSEKILWGGGLNSQASKFEFNSQTK